MAKSDVGKPRGVLNLKAGETKFRLSLHPPGDDLDFFVEQYWIVAWDLSGQEPYQQEVLPHPSIHLVIEKEASTIVGVMRGKFSRLLEGEGRVLGVKFKPGAFYPFVRSLISRFTDATMNLRDAFGVEGSALEAMILSQENDDAMIARMEDFLRERLPERDAQVAAINQIIDRIMADRAITKVDDIVSRLNLNKRTLQRIFNQYVGVSPKWVIKRYRLHEAAERLANGETVDWPKMALDLGYFDQAHFINDFKAIVGKAPADYAREIGADT
jgi:AraC-like DNA-binding protein